MDLKEFAAARLNPRGYKAVLQANDGLEEIELLHRRHGSSAHLIGDSQPANSQHGYSAHNLPHRSRRLPSLHIGNWRRGLIRATATSSTALLVNIVIYAVMYKHYGVEFGTGVLYTGSCKAVHAGDTLIHLALNVVSTLLLGASNYCLQGLISPTRREVDALHAQKKWVTIGVQHWRNLFYISWRRRLGCILLALTTIPVHLFFNSVFFSSSQSNQYSVALVSPNLFANSTWVPTLENTNPALFPSPIKPSPFDLTFFEKGDDAERIVSTLRDVQSNASSFTRLDKTACMGVYAQGFVQDYSDVVVVTTTQNSSNPLLWTRYPMRTLNLDKSESNPDPFRWMCFDLPESENFYPDTQPCHTNTIHDDLLGAGNWSILGHQVDYCIARNSPSTCKLLFNVWMMLPVVVFGIIKVIVMVLMICQPHFDHEQYLRTIGDALASFLKHRDPHTKDMCLVTAPQIKTGNWSPGPQAYTRKKLRWRQSMSSRRFWTAQGWSLAFSVAMSISLVFAIQGAHGGGFFNHLGRADVQSLLHFVPDSPKSSSILPTTIIANIPQLAFSALYLAYNDLFTRMLLADEWAGFALRAKGLRVSEQPTDAQRSSRFLTLPVRWALPMMVYSSLTHWILSQSLFLVRIDGIETGGIIDANDQLARLGYSVIGMISSMTFVVCGALITILLGYLKPLNGWFGDGSNSALLSAACHPTLPEPGIESKPLSWGDITHVEEGSGGIRHCGLSSSPVNKPIVGALYQGNLEWKQ